MSHFYVIGMNDSPNPDFSPEILQIIQSHRVFSGGVRHHEIVRSLLPQQAIWIDIKSPIDEVFSQYEQVKESIVVFASGDPLFFGFANTIKRKLPHAGIFLYPAFNSLQMLAHALLIPYHDLRIVSLTGRPWHEFDHALIERSTKIGILTDHVHTPAQIARRMLEYGYSMYVMYVGINLGNPEKQSIRKFSLQQAAAESFQTPNCVILEQNGKNMYRPFGIPDTCFEYLNGRSRMITKMPVRLLSLSLLDLHEKKNFWDIGFCTGSVSIEAKLQFPHLHITAFEVRQECRELMEINSHRMGTPGIEAIIADFMTYDVSDLASPDAVFIGGHGGKLPEMLQKISSCLAEAGTVVFNSVSEDSLSLFKASLPAAGLVCKEEIRIAVDEFNPITICKAERSKN